MSLICFWMFEKMFVGEIKSKLEHQHLGFVLREFQFVSKNLLQVLVICQKVSACQIRVHMKQLTNIDMQTVDTVANALDN